MRVDSVHKNVWRLASKKVTKYVKGAFIEADLKILKSTICAKCERILYVGERKLVVNGVAPSRERGLKLDAEKNSLVPESRSFAGAWIETYSLMLSRPFS